MGFDLIFEVHTGTELLTHKSHSSAEWQRKMYLRLANCKGSTILDVYAAAVRLFIERA